MIELATTRPSLVQPLRGAEASHEGGTLTLVVAPHFVAFAEMHADEYRDLARRALGQPVKVRIVAGAAAEDEAPPSPEQAAKQRLRAQAEKDPAVQEALELFGGRLADVRNDE
jgi:hypothetical protein